MLFPITKPERRMLEKAQELDKLIGSLSQTMRSSWGNTEVLKATEKELEATKAKLNALVSSEEYQAAGFKEDINKELQRRIPGGNPMVALRVAEELVALLDAPIGKRLGALLGGLGTRAMLFLADEKVNDLRAGITGARYRALIKQGLPEPLVAQLLVAEASRPNPIVQGIQNANPQIKKR